MYTFWSIHKWNLPSNCLLFCLRKFLVRWTWKIKSNLLCLQISQYIYFLWLSGYLICLYTPKSPGERKGSREALKCDLLASASTSVGYSHCTAKKGLFLLCRPTSRPSISRQRPMGNDFTHRQHTNTVLLFSIADGSQVLGASLGGLGGWPLPK